MDAARARTIGSALMLLNSVGIAGKSIFIPLLYGEGLIPAEIVLARLFYAVPAFALLFLLFAPRHEWRLPTLKEARVTLFFSALAVMPIGFHIKAYSLLSPSISAALIYSYPTFVVLFERLIYGKRPEPSVFLAIPLTSAGVLMLVLLGDAQLNVADWTGVAYTISAGAIFALLLTLQGKAFGEGGSLNISSSTFSMWSAICMPLLVLPLLAPSVADFGIMVRPQVAIYTAAFALFSTAIPWLAMLGGIRLLGPTTASLISTMTPVFSVVATAYFLNDTLAISQYLGVVLIVLGLLTLRMQGLSRRIFTWLPTGYALGGK